MEIVSIILRLKNQEIKVSLDEAKELFGQLTAVFGGEKPIVQKEYIPYLYIPTYPWWSKPWWDYQPYVVYSSGTIGELNWAGDTLTIRAQTTGDLISSTTYPINQSTSWVDKDGQSILGTAICGETITQGSIS